MERSRPNPSGLLAAAVCSALVALAGCGSDSAQHAGASNPPISIPVVSGMTPSSGPYGTELIIEGEGFGEVPQLLELTAADDTVRQFESHEWTESRIRARIKFPATGSGEVSFCKFTDATVRGLDCLPGQSRIAAGTFTVVSDWQPGHAQEFWGDVLAARALSDGSVAAISTGQRELEKGPNLVHFGAEDFSPQPIGGLGARPERVVLLEDVDGRPEVVFSSSATEILHYRWEADVLEAVPVGPGVVVAGGSDESGRFVWVSHDFTLSRLRVDDDWAADRTVAGVARTDALTADGTLVAATISNDGDLLDRHYRLNVQVLAPDADTFEPWGEASLRSYDGFPWVDIQVSRDGEVVLVSFCVEDDGSDVNCNHRRVRSASGEWSDPPALPPEAQLTVGQSSLAIAFKDARGVVVQRDIGQPDEVVVPVWPASSVALLVGEDDFRVLVRDYFDVYAPVLLPVP